MNGLTRREISEVWIEMFLPRTITHGSLAFVVLSSV